MFGGVGWHWVVIFRRYSIHKFPVHLIYFFTDWPYRSSWKGLCACPESNNWSTGKNLSYGRCSVCSKLTAQHYPMRWHFARHFLSNKQNLIQKHIFSFHRMKRLGSKFFDLGIYKESYTNPNASCDKATWCSTFLKHLVINVMNLPTLNVRQVHKSTLCNNLLTVVGRKIRHSPLKSTTWNIDGKLIVLQTTLHSR